jgi:hypothetical protein
MRKIDFIEIWILQDKHHQNPNKFHPEETQIDHHHPTGHKKPQIESTARRKFFFRSLFQSKAAFEFVSFLCSPVNLIEFCAVGQGIG